MLPPPLPLSPLRPAACCSSFALHPWCSERLQRTTPYLSASMLSRPRHCSFCRQARPATRPTACSSPRQPKLARGAADRSQQHSLAGLSAMVTRRGPALKRLRFYLSQARSGVLGFLLRGRMAGSSVDVAHHGRWQATTWLGCLMRVCSCGCWLLGMPCCAPVHCSSALAALPALHAPINAPPSLACFPRMFPPFLQGWCIFLQVLITLRFAGYFSISPS